MITLGVINISDRASAGVYEDTPGKACVELLHGWLTTPFEVDYAVIPDEQPRIEAELIRMADMTGCCLVVTTGGTGPAPRDVTPEATRAVIEKELPGFGEIIRAKSYDIVSTSILSRATAGIRRGCLIVNLPGKPTAVAECLAIIGDAVKKTLSILEMEYMV